ncbi:MAG: GyrI-like domain-containing protein [Thiobacillaceae bacterium]
MNYKRLLPFLLAFVLPLLIVYAWWGGFNRVTLGVEMRAPLTYAYVEHSGDYAQLADELPRVREALERAGIEPGAVINVLYSHPERVARPDRQARVGYLVAPGSAVPTTLKIDTLPARRVLVARVRAAMLLAPSRAYQALHGYLKRAGRSIVMPTVEIYEASGSVMQPGLLTVEVESP